MDFQCEYYCDEWTKPFPDCNARKAECSCWLTFRDLDGVELVEVKVKEAKRK